MADDIEAKRQCAAYARHIAWLRTYGPSDMTDDEMDTQALAKVDEAVYGVDAKRDRHGKFIPQGIGAPGRETANHFAAILKYQSRADWEKAVAEIWKRDPTHAARLGLPQPHQP